MEEDEEADKSLHRRDAALVQLLQLALLLHELGRVHPLDERIRDVRTIFNAPNVDVAPRAADVGDGRLSLRRPDGRDARRGALDFLPEALDSGTG